MPLTLQLTPEQEAQLRLQLQLVAPPLHRKRWTFAECQRLETLGLLSSRYELIDGEIIEKMPQNPPHISATQLLMIWLVQIFDPGSVRIQMTLALPGVLGKFNRPEPDVAVTAQPIAAYHGRYPTPAEILLLVEVTDTTLSTDLTQKAALYARAGIGEYWVLDIVGRRLYQHRNPKQGKYKTLTTFEETQAISCMARPEETIIVSQLLPMPSA